MGSTAQLNKSDIKKNSTSVGDMNLVDKKLKKRATTASVTNVSQRHVQSARLSLGGGKNGMRRAMSTNIKVYSSATSGLTSPKAISEDIQELIDKHEKQQQMFKNVFKARQSLPKIVLSNADSTLIEEDEEDVKPNSSRKSSLDSTKEATSSNEDHEPLPEEDTRTVVIKRWRRQYNHFVLGIRFAKFQRFLTDKIMKARRAPVIDSDGLANLIRFHKGQGDIGFTVKVKELLEPDDPLHRTHEGIETLERILSIRLRSFARFTLNQRLQFCSIMHYESLTPETLIVKEGHVSYAFYFILSGQVEIFKIKDDMRYRVSRVGSVGCFI